MPGITSETTEHQAIHDISPDDETTPNTNGHDESAANNEPPTKRRRVSEGTPSSLTRKKDNSPPWKKIVAEGPSSFTQDGKRKSSRTNQLPLTLQPPSDKRQTRHASQTTSFADKLSKGRQSLPANSNHDTNISNNKLGSSLGKGYAHKSPPKMGSQRALSDNEGSPPVRVKRAYNKRVPQPEVSENEQSPARVKRPYKKRASQPEASENEQSPPPVRVKRAYKKRMSQPGGKPTTIRRSARASDIRSKETPNDEDAPEGYGPESKTKSPRIRFKVKPPTLPHVHPDLVLRRPKQYPTFQEYVQNAFNQPIEEGGLFSAEDDVGYTDEMALREARLILRMEDAALPGGVLSEEVSSAYRPEEQESTKRIPRQYSHQDHLVRAVTEFRILMVEEHKKHKRNAKRLAEACRDGWHRKQPKSLEEMEAEAQKAVELRYRSVVRVMQITWDNVKAEVNKRRLKQWEAEEQVRVRKALNEAVDLSTQKLEARRAHQDSDVPSSEEEEDEDDHGLSAEDQAGENHSESDSNMSSSESEADEERDVEDKGGDEHLTLEELKQKYSSLPETPVSMEVDGENEEGSDVYVLLDTASNINGETEADETDESVDMDDDMGSSDDERDSDEEEEDAWEEDGDDQGDVSLLGFLAPSDLAEMGVDKTPSTPSAAAEDEGILDEDDEVSLIPNASHPQSPLAPATDEEEKARAEIDDNPQHPLSEVMNVDATSEAEGEVASADHSTQLTPRTSVTKPSDAESASSIDQTSGPVTPSVAPQTPSNLKTPVPFLLRGTLREYQHYGLDWLAGLYANNTNGILADEMGLGKTIQTIALLAHLACEHHVWGPHLVIVPTSVMLNWEMEFKKWCPGFKILAYYGTQEERKRKRQGWNDVDTWNVCITSYQLVLQDQQVFKRRKWHYMILDEAHNIKNFRSQRWQTLLTFNTRARLLLTGTPLQNNLTELWSLLFFLMPSDGTEQGIGGFADLKEFSEWFKKPQEQILENGRETMDDEARAIITKLHKVLRPYLLRRMKADVEKQMPAKYEHVEYCRLSRRQRELYDGFLSRSGTRETLASGNYLSIINCLMQLRKVCNHPDLFLERPILSSFPMKKSAVASFQVTDLIVRRKLLWQDPMSTVSLGFLNLVPTRNEHLSLAVNERSNMLTAQRVLMDMREAQRLRAQNGMSNMDPSTVKSNLVFLESASRWSRFEELQHIVYLNALRRQAKPMYGKGLVKRFDLGVNPRLFEKRPSRRDRVLEWIWKSSSVLKDMVLTLEQRSKELEPYIQKFACITPPIVAPDALPVLLSRRGVEYFQTAPHRDKPDPFHEARMRLSVQFPDKRLLQYDCGKLQALDKLLRRLQAGGHRALIFTQMTKVLDILEQFLNIHGHRYLRLDGATKIEQRQILTDRFNNDTRILAFILSSRSGGLGINLTGADTVIFYDLDWNPAMDKQCQDRAHRIGQTRDVHIYRLVSEHTIEANILRKANQKRMLDDVVIQEGAFTTDYFTKPAEEVVADTSLLGADAAASAAMDRVLGGPDNSTNVQRVLEAAEDTEDVVAAKAAAQETQADVEDFAEKAVTTAPTPRASGTDTPMDDTGTPAMGATPAPEIMVNGVVVAEEELDAWGRPVGSIDEYMLGLMMELVKDTPLELPKEKSRAKRGKEHRQRNRRER
ncbi:swr1 complex component [Pseudogymnoascus destructans]|uniref:DNA helicase n=2 Tax=Pseudogymnoascus destructans TaxID=655981 RepID=L8FRG0_PSED2|nr:swr1 complex component [Pseudogymnoascus destructans]ELR03053.1 hypothetical protein GMDG_05900 [Pseudogymnoascus destructans 20631-21]OAF58558.1 swr1 complex component [Pseudogymnoascus destructans]